MPGALPGFPDDAVHRYRIALGDESFIVRFRWNLRTRAWYLDLYDADGVELTLGNRLSPQFSPVLLPDPQTRPEGALICVGVDPYVREALGDTLQLLHFTDVEVEAARAEIDVPQDQVLVVIS